MSASALLQSDADHVEHLTNRRRPRIELICDVKHHSSITTSLFPVLISIKVYDLRLALGLNNFFSPLIPSQCHKMQPSPSLLKNGLRGSKVTKLGYTSTLLSLL